MMMTYREWKTATHLTIELKKGKSSKLYMTPKNKTIPSHVDSKKK